MTEQALERLARRVMLDAARLEYGALPEEPPEPAFSPAFERRMKKLLRRGRHPVWYRTLHTAACLLLALVLSGCAVLAASPEMREVFAGWVRETCETHFVYRFFGEEREKGECLSEADIFYRPAYVPEGYRIVYTRVGDGLANFIYADDANHLASFIYFGDTGPSVFQVEREGMGAYKRVSVNGISADLYLDQDAEEANVLIWVDESRGAAFQIHAVLGEAELVKMAESVEAVPFAYRLGWVPEGYEWFDSHSEMPETIQYLDGDGDMILFSIMESTESMEMQVGLNEGDTYKRVSVSGAPADLYLDAKGENSVLIWTDGEEGLVFMLNGALTEEELIRVAEHVEKSGVRLPPHRPAWIPEGYVRRGYGGGRTSFEIRYDGEDGAPIWFRYGEDDSLREDLREKLAGLVPENVQVGGAPARLYTDADGIRHLVWDGGRPGACYWIAGPVSAGELVRMAESVGQAR